MKFNWAVATGLLSLVTAAAGFGQSNSSKAEEAPPTVREISDLISGMSQEFVLGSLRATYRVEHESRSTAKPGELDLWALWSGSRYAGELFFLDGKLSLATKRIWSSGDDDDALLVHRLFTSIFDNSGQSIIEEKPGGMVSRTRDTTAILETSEDSIVTLKTRVLKMIFHGKQFNLTITTNKGDQQVSLDEVVAQGGKPEEHSANNHSRQ